MSEGPANAFSKTQWGRKEIKSAGRVFAHYGTRIKRPSWALREPIINLASWRSIFSIFQKKKDA